MTRAKVISYREFSKDLSTDPMGLRASGGAFRVPAKDSIIVWMNYGVNHIVGVPEDICRRHLRTVENEVLGSGIDIMGRDIKVNRMARRFWHGSERGYVPSDSGCRIHD